MTDITAGRSHHASKVIVHPLTVRITHWLNALAVFITQLKKKREGERVYQCEASSSACSMH
jgi:hypothetical protein